MKCDQPIILGYQEYDFPKEFVGLRQWILRNQNVEFGTTQFGTCSFLICLLEDLDFLQEWLDALEKLLRLFKPTWLHNVRISFFPEQDRSHWVIPDKLLHFLADYHLRLIVSFTGWGDEKCGRRGGRVLRDVTYRLIRRKNSLKVTQGYARKWIEHITLYTSDDIDSFSISPRKIRQCRQKGFQLIVSIRRLS